MKVDVFLSFRSVVQVLYMRGVSLSPSAFGSSLSYFCDGASLISFLSLDRLVKYNSDMAGVAKISSKHREIHAENRKCLNALSLGSASMMILALLLHFSPFVQSYALRGQSPNISKRSLSPGVTDFSADGEYVNYPDDTKYDRYPVVPKRAALIFDRILKGLQSAGENNPFVNDWSPVTRRGNSKDKLYFRCYFNAVSCYKKK